MTLPPDDPANALVLGTALHTGLEKGTEAAIEQYFMAYPIITDEHVDEQIKLEYLIPLARAMLPEGYFEVKVSNGDFIAFLDLLAPVDDTGTVFDLYDFKYSNNADNYQDSVQLHFYKWLFELVNPGKTIRHLKYLMVPKVKIKHGKKESLPDFRKRLQARLEEVEPEFLPVQYDFNKVIQYLMGVKHVLEAKEYPKNQSFLCNWCEYQKYCIEGVDYMILPKNERRKIEKVEKRVVWLYGAPFCGKTTFANKFPDPIMANTDGNIRFVDAPFVPIKDQVTVEGRMTKRTFAWQVFKDFVAEMEKKDNDFNTIIVDLLEDLYEHCRLYMYDQLGISHESDDSFRAWDKVVTEFLSTLKRLMNLDYENIILISHQDTSKDITKKSGDKITAIKPNLREKVALKVAGMVDIVARVVADGENRTLSFKQDEVIFGGGRLTASTNSIDLDFDAFLAVYDEANRNAAAALKGAKQAAQAPSATPEADAPKTSTRTRRKKADTPAEAPPEEAAPAEKAPVADETAPGEEPAAEEAPAGGDRYFFHELSDAYWVFHDGDSMNNIDFAGSAEVTKVEFDKHSGAAGVMEAPLMSMPEAPAEAPEVEEKPVRTRKRRT